MKKTLRRSAILIGAAAMFALPMSANAKIVGRCSDCHTMHNSEEGAPVARNYAVDSTGVTKSSTPNAVLLKYDCLSCHAMMRSNAKVETMDGGSVIPQVYFTQTAGLDDELAGGDFAWVAGTTTTPNPQAGVVGASPYASRKGHNADGLIGNDGQLAGPPGFSMGPMHYHTSSTSTLGHSMVVGCAGYNGCHGVRFQMIDTGAVDANSNPILVERKGIAALVGSHHQDVSGGNLAATDVWNSYRFLLGTKGMESPNWTDLTSDHNEYYGVNDASVTSATPYGIGSTPEDNFVTTITGQTGCSRCHVGDPHATGLATTQNSVVNRTGTMTNFCETCHSQFHSSSTDPNETAFLRHPSDYIIPDRGEYAAIGANYTNTAPIALTDGDTITSMHTSDLAAVQAGQGVVMCLSCHVAHGSPYDHMLRFNYLDIQAGAGTNAGVGCFHCHTAKVDETSTFATPFLPAL